MFPCGKKQQTAGQRSLEAQATMPEARAAVQQILRTFEDLTNRSPSMYRIDRYVAVPKNRVIQSIGLLKAGSLVGAEAWDAVITWYNHLVTQFLAATAFRWARA